MPDDHFDEALPRDVDQDAAESIDALEHGGLPVSAQARLAEMRHGAWTSDLSTSEMALISSLGLQPLGLVMGSAIYRLAGQWGQSYWNQGWGGWARQYPCPHGWYHDDARTGFNWEHVLHEQGLLEARGLAMARLEEEAVGLGAHGVAGVRLTFRRMEGTFDVIEFQAIGTALRRSGRPPLQRPFTSHLSGQELAKLLLRGYVPARLVMGVASVEVDPGCGMEWNMGSWSNVEVDQISDGIQQARELAIRHLAAEARDAGDLVLGVSVDYGLHELPGEARLVELMALGTAVRRFADEPLPDPPLPILRLGPERSSVQ